MEIYGNVKLQMAQNKIVRYILGYGSRHHLYSEDFRNVNYLNVPNRVDYLTLNMMYKIFNNTAPSYMCNFQLIENVHNYRTRYSDMAYVVPKVKTQGSRTFKYNGAKLWNEIPRHIRLSQTKDIFKENCKKYLLSKM